MGRISAILGLAVGVILIGAEFWPSGLPIEWGLGRVFRLVVAVLLVIAGYRTLRKMKGGLRLLCGAWGLTAGLFSAYVFTDLPHAIARAAPDQVAPILLANIRYIVLEAVALAGLAMTVLHKEG